VPGFLAAFLLGVLPLAVLMVILPWYYKPDRFYRSYYRKFVFSLCKYEIAEQGIKVTSDSAESVLWWKAFSGYAETKTLLVLTTGMVQYILPMRAIQEGKLQQLKEILSNKVPPRVR
jgi:chromate transport protein ChrA